MNQINDKGFISVFLILFFPVVLSFSLTVIGLQKILTIKSQALRTCRVHLLDIQSESNSAISELINLNPLAKYLRIKSNLLKASLLSPMPPPQKIKVLNELKRVRKRQKLIRKKQKNIILKTKIKLNLMKNNFKANFYRDFQTPPLGLKPQLAVHYRPKRSLSPSYYLNESFEQDQAIFTKWNISTIKLFPHWIKNFIKIDFKINDSCSTTIVSKGVLNDRKVTLYSSKYL